MLTTRRKSEPLSDTNIFWTTMSDLMLGLCIIFIVLFVLAIAGISRQSLEVKKMQAAVSKQLIEKLAAAHIKAEVDKMTGDIKISDLDLFELNSYTLSPKGKEFLAKLIPIYVNTVFANGGLSDNIENLVVQGHTDSQSFNGVSSKTQQFMRNMDLSLKRADAVANFFYQTNYDKQYNEILMKKMSVEGRSYNEPIFVNGKEDYGKSRRVELRLKVKKWDIMDAFSQGSGND